MKLVFIEQVHVPKVWPGLVETLIYKAIERGGLGSYLQVKRDVYEGRSLLWLAWDKGIHGAAVTQIQQNEFEKACVILACGGTGSFRWLHLLSGLEKYAKASGCDRMRLFGRKGWLRKLPDYKARKIILEKEL